jgi:hypothetical protein
MAVLRTATIGTRDESTDDAGEDHAGGDRADDGEGVDSDPTAHDERLQDMALHLLYEHHGDEDGQCDQGPAGDQRDEYRDDTGEGGADDRDER